MTATPPGFRPPGETPVFQGRPLAAPKVPGQRVLFGLMALFGVLAAAGAVGFFVAGPAEQSVRATVDSFTLSPSVRATPARPAAGPVPKPLTYRGTGDHTLVIRKPERGPVLAYVKGANPGGLFTVSALDDRGRTIGLVVGSPGPYEGVRLLDDLPTLETTTLRIEATGPWTVQLRSVRSAPAFDWAKAGSGDTVLRYTGSGGTATIRGGAERTPFTVTTHANGFQRLLVTALGPFDGTRAMPAGPVLVEVESAGRWAIRVR